MTTVAEVLKQTGLTEEQIAAIDAKQMAAFTTILSTADQASASATAAAQKAEQDRLAAIAAQEKTELERRSLNEFYEQKIVPGLTTWEEEQKKLQTEKANAEALAAFYKTQNEAARSAGFVPSDAPAFTPPAVVPPANNGGRYVAGAPGSTPGSPTFVDPNEIAGRIGNVAGNLTDLQWKYQSLFEGRPLPVAPSQLIAEADAQKMPLMDYAARKFNFAAREQELAALAAKKHDEEIAAAAVAARQAEHEAEIKKLRDEMTAKERKMAEGVGNNPEVRVPPGSSKFAEVARAVKEGTRPDPTKMTEAQRRQNTRQVIHSEIAENAAVA